VDRNDLPLLRRSGIVLRLLNGEPGFDANSAVQVQHQAAHPVDKNKVTVAGRDDVPFQLLAAAG
jgi:hypothetical protein